MSFGAPIIVKNDLERGRFLRDFNDFGALKNWDSRLPNDTKITKIRQILTPFRTTKRAVRCPFVRVWQNPAYDQKQSRELAPHLPSKKKTFVNWNNFNALKIVCTPCGHFWNRHWVVIQHVRRQDTFVRRTRSSPGLVAILGKNMFQHILPLPLWKIWKENCRVRLSFWWRLRPYISNFALYKYFAQLLPMWQAFVLSENGGAANMFWVPKTELHIFVHISQLLHPFVNLTM